MGNLLKMEFSRLSKHKSTLIILISVLLLFFVYNNFVKVVIETTQEIQEQEMEEGEVSVSIGPEEDLSGEKVVVDQFLGQSIMLFLLIFASIFFTAPYKNGFIKNFIGMRSKSKFIMADFITGLFYTLILFAVSTIALDIGQK
ncbi:MAG: hypothetical protein Q4D95_06930, partial [Peptoniphilus sp.]|nr:hypothetical protein [Peptoniphilus sp.]